MTGRTGRTARRGERDVALVWHQVRYEQLSFWRKVGNISFWNGRLISG